MAKAATKKTKSNADDYLRMYRQMVRIRTFEDNANQLYLSAKMPGLTHMYSGEEAVAVGICEALTDDDRITSTHRGHGHCVAKGADDVALRIRELAKEHNIPIVEDPPLARGLFASVELEEVIPPEHFTAVAKVIAEHYVASEKGLTRGVAAQAGNAQFGDHGCC